MNEIYTEEKLLSEMYKNVKMGQENIASVIPKVDDKFMLRVLTARLEQFGAYSQKISDMMHEHGWEPQEPSAAAKLGAKAGIAVNTLTDSTPSHIAEMFIKGSEMGITKLEDARRNTVDCGESTIRLCDDIIENERCDRQKMEKFL